MSNPTPRQMRLLIDSKVSIEDWQTGAPGTDGKADKTSTWHIMPFSNLPLPRPEYPGPVVMVVPSTAVPLITYDGTTDGGGGLVKDLDFVLVQEEAAPPVGSTVQPTSISTAAHLGAPAIATTSTPLTTLFGANGGNPNGGAEDIPTRLSWFQRMPITRWYYGVNQLPAKFNPSYMGGAPEKRTQVSFKWSPTEVIAGNWDARFDAYVTSIPADWYVEMTPWHEPNKELNAGQFTGTQFRNMVIRLSNRLQALGLTHRVVIAPNFTFPRTGGGVAWSDSWMLSADELHPGAVQTWDTYGNPPPSIASGDYPNMVTANADPMFTKNEAFGWEKWAVTEFNAPQRAGDTTDATRITVLDNFVTACVEDGPTKPVHITLWEGNGVQFDQNFTTTAIRNWWKSWAIKSPV